MLGSNEPKGSSNTKLADKHTKNLQSVISDVGTFAQILKRADNMQIMVIGNSTTFITIRGLHFVLFKRFS